MLGFEQLNAFFSRRTHAAALALTILLSVGCQNRANFPWADRLFSDSADAHSKSHGADGAAVSASRTAPKKSPDDPFKLLADENWILAVPPLDQPDEPRYRWRHRALEEILDRPKDRQTRLASRRLSPTSKSSTSTRRSRWPAWEKGSRRKHWSPVCGQPISNCPCVGPPPKRWENCTLLRR